MMTRTVDVLLEDDDEWAKESVFKSLQCGRRTGHDKSDSSDSEENHERKTIDRTSSSPKCFRKCTDRNEDCWGSSK